MYQFLPIDKSFTSGTTKTALIVAAGFAAIYGLSKAFANFEEEDEEEQPKGMKPAGIYNEGNTCFVNSLLQALSSLHSFQKNLNATIVRFRGASTGNQQLICQLRNVLEQINNNSENISVGRLLQLISGIKENLINLEQQDAHELYSALIGCFEEAVSQQKRIDLSASARIDEEELENCLIGYTKSSITCTSCKAETAIKIHPFYDLSLQIRPNHVQDVKSALKEFERQQRIDSWTCSNCSISKHVRKMKQAVARIFGPHKEMLTRIAEQIVLYLEGVDNGELDVGEINKGLEEFVMKFEEEYKSMQGDQERQYVFVELQGIQTTILKRTIITKYPKILVIHLKQLVINPITGYPQLLRKYIFFDENLPVVTKNGTRNYSLTSLLTHIGTQSMGHYFTFRRLNSQSANWFVISDSDSRNCDWNYVHRNKAYMLFYQMSD